MSSKEVVERGGYVEDMDSDMVRLGHTDAKLLNKVRAEGGDFTRIFQRMQDR
jgi:hypothetical protein